VAVLGLGDLAEDAGALRRLLVGGEDAIEGGGVQLAVVVLDQEPGADIELDGSSGGPGWGRGGLGGRHLEFSIALVAVNGVQNAWRSEGLMCDTWAGDSWKAKTNGAGAIEAGPRPMEEGRAKFVPLGRPFSSQIQKRRTTGIWSCRT
jgi:hypothetical protein